MRLKIGLILCFGLFLIGCNRYIVTAPIGPIYGEFYNKTSGGFTFTPSSPEVYYNMTGGVPGITRGFNITMGSQTQGGTYLTAQYGGVYKCNLHLSGEGLVAGGEYGVAIGHNFVRHSNCYANIEGTGSEDVVAISCLLDLLAGDKINILVEDEADPTKAFSVHTFNLNCLAIS